MSSTGDQNFSATIKANTNPPRAGFLLPRFHQNEETPMPWYGSGTLNVAANGANATGTGTQFLGNVRVGDGIAIQGSATLHEVTGITSNTQLTFAPPYAGPAGSGKAYRAVPVLGYDKDLSDAFNQLRLQFGEQLSNLQPWATAPTQDAAQDALGLGTAATRDVVSGKLDTDPQKVLVKSSWGLGDEDGVPPPGNDFSGRLPSGIYSSTPSSTGLPESLNSQAVLNMAAASGRAARLIIRTHTAIPKAEVQTMASGGEWGNPVTIRTSGNTIADAKGILYTGISIPANNLVLTRSDIQPSGPPTSNRLLSVGAGGWLGQGGEGVIGAGYPFEEEDRYTLVYRAQQVDEGVAPYAATFQFFARNDRWGRLRVNGRSGETGAWIQGGNTTYGWTKEIQFKEDTTVDSNGFLKAASPIIKLHSDRIESNDGDAPAFERIDVGHYQLTGTNGLRLDDGWYIETPHDKNGNKYFNVEWEQDYTPVTEVGILDKPADVTLTIRCYERVWNPQTGQYDNGAPVDIPDGRWIDLRLNEVREPEPEDIEEPETQPAPTEPSGPIIPDVVTMAQAKLALHYAGLLQTVETLLNSLPESDKATALIEWNHRQTLERGHPLVTHVAEALELTEQQLDELFVDAAGR